MARVKALPPRIKPAPERDLATVTPGSWRTSNQTAHQRGYNHRWRKARLTYLNSHPLCVHCQQEDRVTPATVVDHIIPHRGDQTLFWDSQGNWQALCKPCHDRKTQQETAQGL